MSAAIGIQMNNIALFATHSIFLTEEEAGRLADGKTISTMGCCVPVWVNAKTGRTTEPAEEIFCSYVVHNTQDTEREVRVLSRKGYEIFIPSRSGWRPPPVTDYEKVSLLSSEDRMKMMKEIDRWWFSNPRPPDSENLRNGYLRFEVKKIKEDKKNSHSEQHVVEIAFWGHLLNSLTT